MLYNNYISPERDYCWTSLQQIQTRGTIIDNIALKFSDAAATYDKAAFVEQEIGDRLFERLSQIKIQPKSILDLGCGTGLSIPKLQKLFPDAQIIGLDFAIGMLNFASKHSSTVCANALQLPFPDNSIDLIFSNCCMPHIKDLPKLFAEVQRVLGEDSLFLFTNYGPDTLQELGMADHWQDMHIIGDLLLKNNFKDPVVDSEKITFQYKQLQDLLDDLLETGAYEIDGGDAKDLKAPCNATFETIYGHAWGKNEKPQARHSSDTFYVEVSR